MPGSHYSAAVRCYWTTHSELIAACRYQSARHLPDETRLLRGAGKHLHVLMVRSNDAAWMTTVFEMLLPSHGMIITAGQARPEGCRACDHAEARLVTGRWA